MEWWAKANAILGSFEVWEINTKCCDEGAASEDSLASIIQVAALEMDFSCYVNRINHKW